MELTGVVVLVAIVVVSIKWVNRSLRRAEQREREEINR